MFGRAGLGGGKQRRVVDGEVAVVVLQDGQSCSLNAGQEEEVGVDAKNVSRTGSMEPGQEVRAA